MATHFEFGQLVIIHGTATNQNKQEITGVLSSQGFTENRVFFQKLPIDMITQVKLEDENHSNTKSLVRNFNETIFQLWPKLSYDAHKEYGKLVGMRKRLQRKKQVMEKQLEASKEGKILDEEDQQNHFRYLEELLKTINKDILKMRERQLLEKSSNQKLLKGQMGQQVSYGSDIQLMHFQSKSFLNGRIICSEYDKSAYKFELSKVYGEGMIFKILPKFKLRQEGEKIQFRDQIQIYNVQLECYVNFSTEIAIIIDRQLDVSKFVDIYQGPEIRDIDQNSQRYESHLSHFQETTFQILLYSNDDEKFPRDQYLKGGDMIRLQHTETNGYLMATQNFKTSNPEIYVGTYQGIYKEESNSVDALWEIERETNGNLGETCTRKENKEQISKYRLRHFRTGRLLSFKEETINGKTIKIPILGRHLEDPDGGEMETFTNSILYFVPTQVQVDNQMANQECYKLKLGEELFVNVQDELEYYNEEVDEEEGQQQEIEIEIRDPIDQVRDTYFNRLPEKFIKWQRRACVMKEKCNEENAFMISLVSEQEKQNVLFVASTLNILKYFSDSFKANKKEVQKTSFLKNVIKILSDLIYFVLDIEDLGKDPLDIDGIPPPSRQRLFKDMKLLELCCEILFYPFLQRMHKLNEIYKFPLIRRILTLTYRLIRHIIREYRPNELYGSQWLDLMMMHAMNCDEENNIDAEPTLTELIDNNTDVLENRIKKMTIYRFVDSVIAEKEAKYVQLLIALVNNEGEAVVSNQLKISQCLLVNKEVMAKVLVDVQVMKQKIIIRPTANVHMELIELKKYSDENDQGQFFEYFTQLICLLSDLCLDRNFIAIKPLLDKYSYDLCFQIITNDKYDPKLRCSFTRLMTTLWIDQEFIPIVLPNKVRLWDNIEKDTKKMCASNNKIDEYTGLKKFITDYIKEICRNKNNPRMQNYQNSENEDRNLLTKAVLALCKKMLSFAFYQEPEQLVELLSQLLLLVNGTCDICDESEKVVINAMMQGKMTNAKPNSELNVKFINGVGNVYRLRSRYEDNKEENILLMEAKTIILEIFEIMFKLINESRITRFLLEFKKCDISELQPSPDTSPKKMKKKKSQKVEESGGLLKSILNNSDDREAFQEFKPVEWIQDIVLKEQVLDFKKFSDGKFVSILLDLVLYKSQDLIDLGFEILCSYFTQQEQLAEQLQDIQIIENEKQIQIYMLIQDGLSEFQTLSEACENWYPQCTEGQNKEKGMALIQILNRFQQYLTEEYVMDNQGFLVVKGENDQNIIKEHIQELDPKILEKQNHEESIKSFTLYKWREGPCVQQQTLIKNLEAYKWAMEIIQYDLETGKNGEYLEVEMTTKVLVSIYKFLAKISYQQPQMQSILIEYLDSFLEHLVDKREIPAHLVIAEVYRNNRDLLMDDKKIKSFAGQIVASIAKLSDDNLMRTQLLEAFRVLTYYKKDVMLLNQTIVMEQLCSKHYDNILILPGNEKQMELIEKGLEIYQKGIESNEMLLQITPQLDYFSICMYTLAVLTEDRNAATESKCQRFFTVGNLVNLLDSSHKCWYFRKNIMLFYFHVYCETEMEIAEHQEDYNSLSEHILDDWHKICLQISVQEEKPQKIKTYKGIESLEMIRDNYLFNILSCVIDIMVQSMVYKGPRSPTQIFNRLLDDIISIADFVHLPKQKQILTGLVGLLLYREEVQTDLYEPKISDEILPKGSQKRNQNDLSLAQGLDILPINRLQQISKQEVLANKIQKIAGSEDFEQKCQQEFDNLIEAIIRIEQESEQKFNGYSTIYFQEIAEALINMIDINDIQCSPEMTITGLKILRKIIEFENQEVIETHKPIYEWEAEDWEDYKQIVVKRQNQLVELEIIAVLGRVISEKSQTNELKIEAINLCIALVLGGNALAQRKFYDYLQKDHKNDFLLNIRTIIMQQFQIVSNKMEQVNAQFEADLLSKKLSSQKSGIANAINGEEGSVNKEEGEENEDDTFLEAINSKEWMIRVFRLLQLFCEGHNYVMQDYLREQIQNGKPNGKTFNFIKYTAQLFGNYIKFVNIHCVDLGDQIVEFLVESLQGPCTNNQKELAQNKIVDYVKDFIALFPKESDYQDKGFIEKSELQEINSLMTSSTQILISLLEGNKEPYVLNLLCNSLDISFLKKRLTADYTDYITNQLGLKARSTPQIVSAKIKEQEQFEGNIEDAFGIYILLVTLADYNSDINEELNRVDEDLEGNKSQDLAPDEYTLAFFQENTKSIEIKFKDDNLYKVYFPLHPVCLHLTDQSKANFHLTVSRDSINDKIIYLLNYCDTVIDQIEHMRWLFAMWFKFTEEKFNYLQFTTTLMAILINLVMVKTFALNVHHMETEIVYQDLILWDGFSLDTPMVLNFLGLVQLMTTLLMIFFWFTIYAPLLLRNKWRSQIEEEQFLMRENQGKGGGGGGQTSFLCFKTKKKAEINIENIDDTCNLSKLSIEETRQLLKLKGPYHKVFNQQGGRDFGNIFTEMEFRWRSFRFLFFDGTLSYMLFYLSLSLIGLSGTYLTYSFQLIDIAQRSDTLLNVLQACNKNWPQLLLTFFLGLIIIYVYTMLAFNFWDETYWNGDISWTDNGERTCQTILSCFMTTMSFGIRSGGGISELIKQMSYQQGNKERYFARLIYDLSWFLVVQVTFMNIIFGIIIDTFAELREAGQQIIDDKTGMCFICGIDKFKIERNSASGFNSHYKRDHLMWNYLFYIYSLRNKDETDYNGIESYVEKKIQEEDISWFPIYRALAVRDETSNDVQDLINEKIDSIQGRLTTIDKFLDNYENIY